MTAPHLSPTVVAILSMLIEERAGLHYSPEDQGLLMDRVWTRAQDAGFESLLDYYYFLRYDDAGGTELEKLLDTLVVNETFFFRELDPLRVLVSEMLEPAVARGARTRVWSAACATGEEPLTLAMLLAEKKLLDRVDILASDISHRALERARAGQFPRRAIRDFPETALTSRFLRETAQGFTVDPELVKAVKWRRLNLCVPADVAQMPVCDVILCRNVLIYFSDDTVVKVLGALAGKLKDDGALFVGVSESLLRFGTGLDCEERNGVFFYRKSADGSPR